MSKKDLTGIHFLEKTSYCDGGKNAAAGVLWTALSLAAFILIQLSAFAILFDGLSMAFSVPAVLAVIAAVSVVLWALSARWQLFLGGSILLCLGLGITVWRCFDRLSAGFLSIVDRVQVMVTEYMSGSRPPEWQGELTMLLYGFLAAAFCFCGAVCYFALKSALLVLAPGVLWMLGVFLVGKVPDLWWTAVFCISGIVFVSGSCSRRRFGKYGTLTALGRHFYIRGSSGALSRIGVRTGILMLSGLALAVGAALLWGAVAGLPSRDTLERYQSQVRDWTREKLHLSMGPGKSDAVPRGGISGGDLASAGDLYYYGDEQIEVTVGEIPESNLYIKGYVGDTYGSNRWTSRSGGDYDGFSQVYGFSGEMEARSVAYTLLSPFGQDHMTITKRAVFGDYEFFPYGAEDADGKGWINDLYIYGSSTASDFDFAPVIYPLAGDFEDLSLYAQQTLSANSSLSALEEDYQAFVKTRYVQLPQETGELLDWLTGSAVPQDLAQKLRYVRQFLADTCQYSLTPGALPAGEDFTEYFLTENRRGYCMHFATAATLMLRNMGVPARYVEGYIMAPGNFSPSAEGYSGIAYDHQAHAWTEIYLDGVGWLPAEMTPGFYDPAQLAGPADEQPESQTQVMESESAPESETANDSGETQTPEESTETAQDTSDEDTPDTEASGSEDDPSRAPRTRALNRLLKVLMWIGAAAAAVALAAVLIALRAAALHRKRLASMNQRDRSRAAAAIYQELMRLLKICGCGQLPGESMARYFERLAGEHSCVDAQACMEFVALANEAAFSSHGISTEQWLFGRRLYQTIRRGMYRDQKRLRRLFMNFWYAC